MVSLVAEVSRFLFLSSLGDPGILDGFGFTVEWADRGTFCVQQCFEHRLSGLISLHTHRCIGFDSGHLGSYRI